MFNKEIKQPNSHQSYEKKLNEIYSVYAKKQPNSAYVMGKFYFLSQNLITKTKERYQLPKVALIILQEGKIIDMLATGSSK